MTDPTTMDPTSTIEQPQDVSQTPAALSDEAVWDWASVLAVLKRIRAGLTDVSSNPKVAWGVLVVILLVASALRFVGLDWDEHQHLHPDERFLTMVENSLQWPESFKQYLTTAENPLNPYNHGHGTYVYGLFPVVFVKAVGHLVGKTGYDGIYLVGRAVSGVMDLLCVLLVFAIGKRLYDARVGLVGAVLLAFTALNIQQSHFFTVDTATTLYVTLALYLAVCVAQNGRWPSILLLGAAFGLAVACKISVLSFLLVIGLAFCLRIWSNWSTRRVVAVRSEDNTRAPDGALVDWRGRLGRLSLSFRVKGKEGCPELPWERLLIQALWAALAILVILIVAVFVFRVAQPQAFTGPGLFNFKVNLKWKQDMEYVTKLVSGEIDYPPSHQWTARPAVWYMLKNQVLWGMGLPMGLAVWVGWALMAVEMYRRQKWAHLLPWVWMSFTFFYQSIQFVKTVRYLLPIYPTMALVGGYCLVRLWDWAVEKKPYRWLCRAQHWLAPAARGVVVAVVLLTALWGLAFTGIYTRPVTRIEASRWIYRNIPSGSSISFEVWDDPIPLNIDGHNASLEYRHIKMDLYWEDIPEKVDGLISAIEQIEYIALSSNRLYGSIPRLPTRYPVTTRYYEALFSGELGYDPLVTFTSRPRLFGIEVNDDDADESFTVYDHPKVTIFRKRADFDIEKVRAILGGYDLDRIVRIMPRQVTKAPNNLMLDEDEWATQRGGGTWSDIFDRDGLTNKLPTLTWLLAVTLLGWVGFPYAFVAFWRMRGRGYVLAKSLGMLLVGYLSWLVSSLKLLPYVRGTIWGAVALVALGAVAIVWRRWDEIVAFVRARWRLLLVNELLFLAFFFLFWLIRRANPDLWHPAMGGEKPMDLAYLNAIIKSTHFPAYDPWFAGGYLNYYYFGWVIVATLIKLTGIVPWVAYNLTIPTFFALVAMGACTVVQSLLPTEENEHPWFPRALRFGLVGAALVAVVGNLGEAQLLVQGLKELGQHTQFESTIPGLEMLVQMGSGLWAHLVKGQQMPFRSEWWYWNASRIMKHGEINEFPFFTFLYADLHAHLTAMPFAVLALGLASSLLGLCEKPRKTVAREVSDDKADVVIDINREGSSESLGEAVVTAEEAEGLDLVGLWDATRARLRAWRDAVDWTWVLQLTLLGLVVGELWCNNSWDYPTYMGISLVAAAIGIYGRYRRIDRDTLTRLALSAGYLVFLSVLLYRPYHSHFGLAYSSVERWKGERTPISAYLIIHGTTLFILVTYLVSVTLERGMRNGWARAARVFLRSVVRGGRGRQLYGLLVRCQSLAYEMGWLALTLVGLVMLALLVTKSWFLLVSLPILLLAGLLVLYEPATPERRFHILLIAVGMALVIGVDYVAIKGDIGRMNTVFKFYLQVWIMWGIAAAVALAHLSRSTRAWPDGARKVWRVVLGVLLVGVSLYPPFATYGKVRDRWNRDLPASLDGMAYMTTAVYHDNNQQHILDEDRQAIIWMQDHIAGSPVVAEANTPLYRWGGRVSIYTGLPSIIGWDWHQKQQRAAVSGQVVDWRLQDLRELYNTYDIAVATEILKRYDVGYVYVGSLERAYYDGQGLAKFDQMVGLNLTVVYDRANVIIYRVTDSGAREIATDAEHRSTWCSGSLVLWLQRNLILGPVAAEGPEKAPSGNLVERTQEADLMLDMPVDQLPPQSARGWNEFAKRSTLLTIVCWWLVVELIGMAAYPLTSRILGRLADSGYALTKGVGLLIVGYLVWLGASLKVVANSPPVAWAAVGVLGGMSFFLWRRRRHEQSAAWHRHRRLILVEEALFTGAFLVFVGYRILNPDLWQPWFGGEKTMEVAILNAIVKSAHMPPYDPYFAGGYLNYYYYGQYLAALLIELVGVTPEVGFNLAVPTLYGLTVSHAFGVAYHLALGARPELASQPAQAALEGSDAILDDAPVAASDMVTESAVIIDGDETAPPIAASTEPLDSPTLPVMPIDRDGLWAGIAAVVLVAVIGNLSGAVQTLERLARAGGAVFEGGVVTPADAARVWPGLWGAITGQVTLPPFEYWYRGTRIIPHTINEFPFFSFLFADLHPHMIGIPFTILAVGLFLGLAVEGRGGAGSALLRWGVLVITVGALGIINTWDLPAYYGILGCVMLYRGHRLGRWKGLGEALISWLLLVLASVLAYAPFYAHYRAQSLGVDWVASGERSQTTPFLVIWGFLLFVAVSVMWCWNGRAGREGGLSLVARWGWRRGLVRLWLFTGWRGFARVALPVLIALLLLGSVVALLLADVALVAMAPLLLAAGLLLLCQRKEAHFVQALLMFVGVGILAGVEVIYIQDFLAGNEWRRMNTLFKFYIQAWVMLGLVCGSALPAVWRRKVRDGCTWRNGWAGPVWRGAFGLLLAASLVYTIEAIPARVDQRFPSAWPVRNTLDGTAYMRVGVYHWPDEATAIDLEYERQAIAWLWENVRGTPVIAEAPIGFYREGGLRASSYTGLPTLIGMHEREQRPWEVVSPRERDAEMIYTTSDATELSRVLERYRVSYIYVGQLEEALYDVSALDGFVRAGMLERVYQNDRVRILRVPRDWDA